MRTSICRSHACQRPLHGVQCARACRDAPAVLLQCAAAIIQLHAKRDELQQCNLKVTADRMSKSKCSGRSLTRATAPCAGNVTALGFSLIVTTVLSFVFPQNFDWDVMRTGIRMVELDGTDLLANSGEDSAEGLESALKCASQLKNKKQFAKQQPTAHGFDSSGRASCRSRHAATHLSASRRAPTRAHVPAAMAATNLCVLCTAVHADPVATK